MKEIDISYREYASKYWLTDFYLLSEDKLRAALDSGEDFDTGWFGCKKEIRYARYRREGEDFTIDVSAHMDDLYESEDLIYDALWEVCKMEELLPEHIIDSIKESAIDDRIDDVTTLSKTIPSETATFSEVVRITCELEEEAEKQNAEMYKNLCQIVSGYVQYMKGVKNEGCLP